MTGIMSFSARVEITIRSLDSVFPWQSVVLRRFCSKALCPPISRPFSSAGLSKASLNKTSFTKELRTCQTVGYTKRPVAFPRPQVIKIKKNYFQLSIISDMEKLFLSGNPEGHISLSESTVSMIIYACSSIYL